MKPFKAALSRRRIYNDLSRDSSAYEEKADELVTSAARKEATAAARRGVWKRDFDAEDQRAVWQWPSIESFFADVRYGARCFAEPQRHRSHGFTLALAIARPRHF